MPEVSSEAQQVLTVPWRRIRPCKDQPRKHFNQSALRSLATSIKTKGQKTPAEVKPLVDDPHHDYELTDGERRWRAIQIAELETMRIWVNPVADADEQFINSVMSNFGREGHTPMETARAIQRILAMPEYADGTKTDRLERVAKLFTKSGSWAGMHLKLLELHPEVQAMLDPNEDGEQALGIAFADFLGTIEQKPLQLKIAKRAVKHGMTLTQARRMARKVAEEAGVTIGKRPRLPSDVRKAFERFLEKLNDGTESIMELPKKPFHEMIRNTDPSARHAILTQINAGIEQLKELKEVIERASQ